MHPKAKKIQVLKKSAGCYDVWVREAPDKGKANEAVIEALSDYFGTAKSRIQILRGQTSKNKLIQVD